MRKFIVKKTGEPIKIGQFIRTTINKKFSFGSFESIKEELLTESNVGKYICEGILEEVNDKVKQEIPNDINFYVLKIAKKLNIEVNAVYNWLDLMNKSGYSLSVLNMLIKEIKSVINHKYKDKVIPELKWFINPENGIVYSMKSGKTKHTACFYSKEDAELAKLILKDQFDFMFK